MWPHRVVDPLPLSQLAVEFLHLQRAGRDLIKLLGVSPLGALDRAVELGRSRWQNEQAQAALLAGLLEVGSELGTAIHLQSTDGKGHAVQQGFQELGSGRGGGPRVGLDDVPARDHIAGGELLEDYARQGTRIKSIDLDEVSRPGNRVLLGFADGVRAGAQGATVHAAAGRLPQTAMAFQLAHDAAHHGSGNPESAAGAAEPRACPCPSEDSAGAGPGRDRPGGSARGAGGDGAGGECALPG